MLRTPVEGIRHETNRKAPATSPGSYASLNAHISWYGGNLEVCDIAISNCRFEPCREGA